MCIRDSHYPIDENVAKTKELVAVAHAMGMSIEAEASLDALVASFVCAVIKVKCYKMCIRDRVTTVHAATETKPVSWSPKSLNPPP